MVEERETTGKVSEAQPGLERAYRLVDVKYYIAALEACQQAIKAAPRSAEAHTLFGLVLEELDRLEEALGAYHTALDLDPAFAEARENLDQLFADLLDANLVAVFGSGVERHKEMSERYLDWAREWKEAEEPDLALQACKLSLLLQQLTKFI